VAGFRSGDRVAYITPGYGAYAQGRLIEAERLVRLPDSVSDVQAAAAMVKGLTAWLLLHRVHSVRAGQHVLVHAAAGGVGRLLCAWASHLGATVIATVGSPAKAEAAHRSGCRHVILYREEDFVARVAALTGGSGVAVAYDSVGRDTFLGSFACLAPLGHLVSFGQSSGMPEPITMAELAAKSITITRPVVFHYMQDRAVLEQAASAVFAAIASGILDLEIAASFALAEAGEAHRMLETRQSTGSLVLLP
jgi:NADPH2:quinone reductase